MILKDELQMGADPSVRLDLNNPVFQHGLFQLQKAEQLSVLGTLRKLSDMTWNQGVGLSR